jgi:hypothetical protein
MIDDSDCGAIGGINIGRENRSTQEKNLHQSHFVHQKSHMTETGLPRWEANE